MKKTRLLIVLLLSLVMALCLFAFAACDDEPSKKPSDSTTLKLSTTTLSVEKDDSEQITVTYNGKGTLTYTVNKTDIATVEKDADDQKKATVTGVEVGTATLTVTDGKLTKTCAITVKEKEEPPAPKVSLKLSDTERELVVDDTTQIDITYDGEGTITCSSTDESVATAELTADKKHVTITAVGEGTATINVTDGALNATCSVTVTPKPETVTIMDGENEAEATLSLEREGTKQFTAETTNGSPVTWVSTNETVATVNSDGLITAIRPGKTTIRASVNSTTKDEVALTVTRKDEDPYYELKASAGSGSWTGSNWTGPAPEDNEFYYWANFQPGWVQAGVVDIKEAYYEYNTLVMDYSGVQTANAVQLHLRKNESVTVGGYYVFTAKIYSSAAGPININGNVFELKKGDNAVSMYFHTEKEDEKLFYMIVGKEEHSTGDSDIIKSARLEIYDIVWAEDQDRVELVAPAFSIDEDGVITITDDENDADAVAEYRLGFFKDDKEVASTVVTDGEPVDISVVESDDYTVEIKAVGVNCHYIDSAYSETNTVLTVENEAGRSYALKEITEEDDTMTPGEWAYARQFYVYQTDWDHRDDFTAKFESGTANVSFKNNEAAWTALQLLYHPTDAVTGKVYKIDIEISVEPYNNELWITSQGNAGAGEGVGLVNGATTAWATICGTEVEISVDGTAHTYTVYAKAVDDEPLVTVVWGKDAVDGYNRVSRGTVHVANPTTEEITPTAIETPSFSWDGDDKIITITDENNEEGTVDKYVVGFFGEDATDKPSYTIDVATTGPTGLDLSVVGEGTYTIKVKAVAASYQYTDSSYAVNDEPDTVEIKSLKLSTPTFTYDPETMTVTVSDSVNESNVVSKYVVGLFEEGNDEPISQVNVYGKDAATVIYFSNVEAKEYTIKVKAAGIGAAYPDSDWTETSENITVKAATAIALGGEGDATGDPDKWYLFSNTTVNVGVSTNGNDLDTVIVIDYTGGANWWSVQLFREISGLSGQHTITFDLTVEFADTSITEAKIKVNGNDQTVIKAGEINPIEQKWTEGGGASISIQFGTASPEKALPGRYIISNIKIDGKSTFGETGEA